MPSQVPIIYFKSDVTNTLILVNAGYTALVGWMVCNHSTGAYLKLWNAVQTSDVSLGVTVPDKIIPIPTGPAGLFFLSNEDKFQQNFNKGIVIAVVSGLVDSSSAAPAAACSVELSYDNRNQ
jgi:hypothetical protein